MDLAQAAEFVELCSRFSEAQIIADAIKPVIIRASRVQCPEAALLDDEAAVVAMTEKVKARLREVNDGG